MEGTHPIYRRLIDHWLWEDKPFAKGQAWVDLILLANHKDSRIFYNNVLIDIKRGQVFRSKLTLAKRWGWSRSKLERFLNRLETEKMTIQQPIQQGTLVTLLNYSRLHKEAFRKRTITDTINDTTVDTTTGQQSIQRQDTYNNNKNVNNEKNVNINTLSAKKKQTQPEVKMFINWWFEKYQERFNEKYNVSGGKDGSLVKGLLAKYGWDKLVELAERFWGSYDKFIIDSGFSIGVFHSQINKLIADSKRGGKTYTEAQLRTMQSMKEWENGQKDI